MRFFIKSLFCFILFIPLFYVLMVFIWGSCAPRVLKPNLMYPLGMFDHNYTRLSEVKKETDIDILFLGSSLAYREFDTRIFRAEGYKTFNLGSSSQTPLQTKVLLNRYLKRLNPKLIIYEVDPDSFTLDGIESALGIIANDINDFGSVKMALKLNNIKVYNALIYGFLRDVFNLNSTFVEPVKQGDEKYVEGGFVEREIKFFRTVAYPKQNWSFNIDQAKAFDEIISMIRQKNIETILVFPPYTASLCNSYMNNDAFDGFMKSRGKYYNLNNKLNLSDSLDFYDMFHLNQNGVRKFNKEVIEILNNSESPAEK